DLWQRIRRTITAFLLRVWRDGALFGATPEEAFFVKCDSETNPPEMVDAGYVTCQIGIAPVKPAEFVVFQIAQFSGGADLSESREDNMPIGEDALAGYSFSVEIDGVSIAQFRELSGLSAEIQVIEHRENKVKGLPVLKKLPGHQKYGDLTLKRGRTDNKALW